VVIVDADRGAHVGEHLALQLAQELADDAREVGFAGDGVAREAIRTREHDRLAGDRDAGRVEVLKLDVDDPDRVGWRAEVDDSEPGLVTDGQRYNGHAAEQHPDPVGEVGADEAYEIATARRTGCGLHGAERRKGHAEAKPRDPVVRGRAPSHQGARPSSLATRSRKRLLAPSRNLSKAGRRK